MGALDQRRDSLWVEVSLGAQLPSSRVSLAKWGLEMWAPHPKLPGAGRGWLTLTPFPRACSSLSTSPEIPEHPLASHEDREHQAGKQEALPTALCQGPGWAAPDLCSAFMTAATVSFPRHRPA